MDPNISFNTQIDNLFKNTPASSNEHQPEKPNLSDVLKSKAHELLQAMEPQKFANTDPLAGSKMILEGELPTNTEYRGTSTDDFKRRIQEKLLRTQSPQSAPVPLRHPVKIPQAGGAPAGLEGYLATPGVDQQHAMANMHAVAAAAAVRPPLGGPSPYGYGYVNMFPPVNILQGLQMLPPVYQMGSFMCNVPPPPSVLKSLHHGFPPGPSAGSLGGPTTVPLMPVKTELPTPTLAAAAGAPGALNLSSLNSNNTSTSSLSAAGKSSNALSLDVQPASLLSSSTNNNNPNSIIARSSGFIQAHREPGGIGSKNVGPIGPGFEVRVPIPINGLNKRPVAVIKGAGH
eukprot:TRINITY_DN1395_c0_g1_i10.p1 TRINITY_DN1395_c0_g1~~TRINITY_DN1395_c0_g1_i10.p1  ORF type:complete len:344 (-),score=52.55 TRINITY_DN1395_c0_g1_i10:444-1475(-)